MMHIAIAITLLFAAATAALGLRRPFAIFLFRASWLTFLPLLTQAGMMVWFAVAGVWQLAHE
jgi:hypothetical protein